MNSDPFKEAWQASVDRAEAPSLDVVRETAEKFYRRVKLRNTVEYVANAILVVACAIRFFTWEHILHKAGFLMLMIAGIYAPWQLHRRASAVSLGMAEAMPANGFLRCQLVRQRDALKTICWWYLLPYVPGLAFVFAGNGLDPKIEAAGPPHWVRWLVFAALFVVFFGAWWLNQLGARKLQKRIDEIDALTDDAR